MPPKKPLSAKEKKALEEKRRLDAEKSVVNAHKSCINHNKQRLAIILERFGPNSELNTKQQSRYNTEDMDRYNAVKLPVPKGLNDEMVAMIALGEAMNPSRLKKSLTSSTVASNIDNLSWNQSFIVENVIGGDGRTKNFGVPLCEAKEKTVDILNEYAKGNVKPTQEALKRIVGYIAESTGTQRTESSCNQPRKEMFRIINEMRRIPALGIDDMLSEKEKARLTVLEVKMKASDKSEEIALKLVEEMPALDSKEREKLVFEYLFNIAVGSSGYNGYIENILEKETSREVEELADAYAGLDKRSQGSGKNFLNDCIMYDSFSGLNPHGKEINELGKELTFASDSLKLMKIDELFAPADGIIARDGNTDVLRALAENEIRNSKLFNELMKAESKLEMDKLLNSVPKNGFDLYPNVKIPDDEAKKYADKDFPSKYMAAKKKVVEKFEKYSKAVYPEKYAEKFEFHTEAEQMKKEPEIIIEPILFSDKMYRNTKADEIAIRASSSQVEKNRERRQVLTNMYGMNGKLSNEKGCTFSDEDIKTYNEVKLPETKGLTDDMIAVIVMGASMDPSRTNQQLTMATNLSGGGLLKWNHDFILSSLTTGDDRSKDFGKVLIEGRKDAAEILNEYNKGNFEPAKQVIKRVVDIFADSLGTDCMSYRQEAPRKQLYSILSEMMKKPELGLENMLTEPQRIKIKVGAEQLKYGEKAQELKNKLTRETPAKKTKEREKEVVDFLFFAAAAGDGNGFNEAGQKRIEDDMNRIAKKYAVLSDMANGKGTDFLNKCIINNPFAVSLSAKEAELRSSIILTKTELQKKLFQTFLTPTEGIIAADGNAEKLRVQAEEHIKKSKVFKELMNKETPAEMEINLRTVTNLSKGFSIYPDMVISDNDAKRFAVENDEYKKTLAKFEKNLDEYCRSVYHDEYLMNFEPNNYMKEQAAKAVELLGADRFGHHDSKEIKAARRDAKALQEAMNNSTEADIMKDPKVRQALLKAYQSNVAYKNAKKKAAKRDIDDMSFMPESEMGKDRYKGSSTIEALAEKFIMTDILQAEEEKRQKEWLDTSLKKGSASDMYMKKAQEILKSSAAEMNAVRRDSLADIPKADELSKELAQVIAVNIVGKAYDKYSDTEVLGETSMGGQRLFLNKHGYSKRFYDNIKLTRDDIMKRDDFKAMISELSVEKALELGMSKDGKNLVMELSKAAKKLIVNEKNKKAPEAEKQLNAEIKRSKM